MFLELMSIIKIILLILIDLNLITFRPNYRPGGYPDQQQQQLAQRQAQQQQQQQQMMAQQQRMGYPGGGAPGGRGGSSLSAPGVADRLREDARCPNRA